MQAEFGWCSLQPHHALLHLPLRVLLFAAAMGRLFSLHDGLCGLVSLDPRLSPKAGGSANIGSHSPAEALP
ncbi:hypothetical protein GGI35DRAFT_406797 [Trichoderma velutinum]